MDLYADNNMIDPEPLAYPDTNEVFKGIEMSEIIPSGGKHFDFAISPSLPNGLSLDSQTGWICGTASDISAATTYTVTATKFTGGTATATFSLAVSVCSGDRSLMTVRFRADANNNENSWKLFQGRGTTGTILQQVNVFPYKTNYYYVDFCLNSGIYTLQGSDSWGDGWQVNTGYTLTADIGEFELEVMELSSGTAPVSTTSTFSTFFPFQVNSGEWKIYQGSFVEGWNGLNFDDSNWISKKSNEIPTTEEITTYIRKSFSLTNVADYQVLNIRLKYSGGIACYFNGNLVARLNLADDFEPSTESLVVHDSSIFSKFHIILPTSGVVEGLNVIAFEVHRPVGASSTEPIVFDATGVFGVEDCSTVVDSFSALESTNPTAGSLANIMDLDPYTTGTLPNAIDTYIEWTVDNLLGSKFNTFNLYTAGDLFTRDIKFAVIDDKPIVLYHKLELMIPSRTRMNLPVNAALAGFRQFRIKGSFLSTYDIPINSLFMNYCKATGATCPAIDNYPSVGEGQISPSGCPEGYRGYSYRECSGGQLGDVKLDHCSMKPPANARYSKLRYQFVKDTVVTTGAPSATNIVSRWYVDSDVYLPAGLTLNEENGEISGTPTDVLDMTSFTIYAENESGATSVVVTLQIRKGQCMAEGVFPVTEVGEIAVYQCALQGSYIGTQRRACILGTSDGEWLKATGFCMSVIAIVLIVLIVIVIVVVFIFLLVRSTRKAKAIGGVKGSKKGSKTSTKSAKSVSKKGSNKAVKV